MAAKKTKKTTKKKASAKGAKKKTARAHGKPRAAITLTLEERLRAPKPPPDYDEIVEKFARVWAAKRASVRVPGASPAKLRAQLARAERAWSKEEAFREQHEQKLRALSDARVVAEGEVWQTLLDVYAVVKGLRRRDPSLAEAFSFVGEEFTRGSGSEPAEGGGTAG